MGGGLRGGMHAPFWSPALIPPLSRTRGPVGQTEAPVRPGLLLPPPAGPLRAPFPGGPWREVRGPEAWRLDPRLPGALGSGFRPTPRRGTTAAPRVCLLGDGAAPRGKHRTVPRAPAAAQVDHVVDHAAGEVLLGQLWLGGQQVPHGVADRGQDVFRVAGVAGVTGEEPGHLREHLVPWRERSGLVGSGDRGTEGPRGHCL